MPCLMQSAAGAGGALKQLPHAGFHVMLHAFAAEPKGAALVRAQSGMAEMSEAFRHKGAEVYLEPASLP